MKQGDIGGLDHLPSWRSVLNRDIPSLPSNAEKQAPNWNYEDEKPVFHFHMYFTKGSVLASAQIPQVCGGYFLGTRQANFHLGQKPAQ